MHSFITFTITTLLAAPASAFWRLPCVSPLVQERADPIVNPGAVAGHLHTIMGGNGFGFTMDYASTQASTCSSCTVQGDTSNYWTPVLFYQGNDGSFQKVDQVGGATVYYLQRNATNEKIVAFPEGFRMLAGDPYKRSGGSDAASQAISYHCLDYSGADIPETGAFPTANCPDGVRSQVFFPSCWDGTNLDSSDHKSHVSYPDGAYNAGTCPSTHPVRLMALFYEIIWDTNKFKDQWYGSNQPFVWSMGDPTGYGFHGDFVNGWDVNLLQKAADQCTNLSGRVEDCALFTLTADATASGCQLASQVNDQITGTLTQMPGCNPVQSGPAEATKAATCTASTTIQAVNSSAYFTDLTSQGWGYLGCATDNYYNRSMIAATTTDQKMTNSECIQYCASKGYSMAGTEYSDECYCGNTFPWDRLPVSGTVGNCDMTCAGDSSQKCGGSGLLSLYKKCSGSSCTNAQIGVSSNSVAESSSATSSTTLGSSTTSKSSTSMSSSTSSKASTTGTTTTTSARSTTSGTTTKSGTGTSTSTSASSTSTSTTSRMTTTKTGTSTSTTGVSSSSTTASTSKTSTSTTTTTTTTTTTSSSSSSSTSTAQCTAGPRTINGRTCTVLCNTDRPGGDYSQQQLKTWELCVQACAADTKCATAQYHSDIGYCYFKNVRNGNVTAAGEDTVDCDPPKKLKRASGVVREAHGVVVARGDDDAPLGVAADRVAEAEEMKRDVAVADVVGAMTEWKRHVDVHPHQHEYARVGRRHVHHQRRRDFD